MKRIRPARFTAVLLCCLLAFTGSGTAAGAGAPASPHDPVRALDHLARPLRSTGPSGAL
ncbi:hypothetical protein ACFYT4_01905 [Streptomyces sp. NPDC004609]|uniref:hypothetical protein n=1 Tax=Streptomyces sp. NPDC004609 TaxID=3364704 RepID=UPI00367F4689